MPPLMNKWNSLKDDDRELLIETCAGAHRHQPDRAAVGGELSRRLDIEQGVGHQVEQPQDEASPGCVQQAVAQHGDRRAIIAHIWGIVEGTSTFLGIENCWKGLGMHRDLMTAWFDRYADWLGDLVDSCIDAGADIITLSDDWGSNQNMLFSPRMWRSMIKPYAERVIQRAAARNVPVNLHSDGYIMQIMDELVEMGFSMMHPVQESAGMDPQTIKTQYGDDLVIYGSLDVIDGLLAYEGEELDRYISDRFAIYAPGGGFIFNTGHFVQPDIPPQRLVRAYTVANELASSYGS